MRDTSGGLGQDDTYGGQAQSGGTDTGRDGNFGMGSGRTNAQDVGGMGSGDDSYGQGQGGGSYGSGGDNYGSGQGGSGGSGGGLMDKIKDKMGMGGNNKGDNDNY